MIALYIILGIIALILVLHSIAPKTYEVSRTTTIDKPKAEVFNYLKFLKNQDDWAPWGKRDPNMEKSFTGTDGEIGATSYWNGNKDVGEGEQEVTQYH